MGKNTLEKGEFNNNKKNYLEDNKSIKKYWYREWGENETRKMILNNHHKF